MPDKLDDFMMQRPPTPERPLLGQTVLVVEDSRFASEAMRLLCLRSGARIRRADSLAAAARHLTMYHPSVAVVDLGLPDGSGLDLIAEMAAATPRVPVILASSADDDAQGRAMEAGADGFLPKPINSIAAFQNAVLELMPDNNILPSALASAEEAISPDRLALRDDLAHVAEVLTAPPNPDILAYLAQFVGGIAKTSHDAALQDAAARLGKVHAKSAPGAEVAHLQSLVAERLKSAPIV